MKKLVLSLCLCILLPYIDVFAQLQKLLPITGNQQMINTSVSEGLFLIRQEYQLEDTLTHKRYTLDNRPDFGSVTSFGVRTEYGYIVRNETVMPWEKDRQYEQYRNSQYRPVLSRTLIRTVKDSTWREAAPISPQCVLPMKDPQWVEVKDSLYTGGIFADYSDGEKLGWIVWLTCEKEHNDSSALSLITYRRTLELSGKNDDDIAIKTPDIDFNVFGGIYINPYYERMGQITFKICGIIIKQDDSWVLLRCASGFSIGKSVAEETDTDKAPVLTPLDSEPEHDDGVDKNPKEKTSEKHNKKRKK